MALACHLVGCNFVAPGGANPAMNMAAIVNHMALVHPDQLPYGARDNQVKPPPLVRPSIDLGCSPAQWADFITRWTQHPRSPVIDAGHGMLLQGTYQHKAIFDIGTLSLDDLMRVLCDIITDAVPFSLSFE